MTLAVPPWAREAITRPHTAKWSATLKAPTKAPVVLPITAGTMRADSTAWPRYTAELALGDMSLAPRNVYSDVLPFGTEVTLEYQLTDSDGRTLVLRPAPPMLVDTVRVSRGDSVGLSLTTADRTLAISTDMYAVPASMPPTARTVSTAIAYIIRRTFPGALINDAIASSAYVGNGFTVDGDPWAAIEGLADTIGADVYIDPTGTFRVVPSPAIKNTASDTFRTGEGGTITAVTSSVIRGYNRVLIVFRDAEGRVVIGRWADESSGPLDVNGLYGRVTYSEDRDREATPTEANDAAERLARRTAGRVRDVELEAVGAPWIEPGDTVALALPTGTDTLVVSAVEHDLSGVAPSRYTFRTDTVGPV